MLDALEIDRPNGVLVLECQQHIGEDTIRAIAMDSTDGLMRGMPVREQALLLKCLLVRQLKDVFLMLPAMPLMNRQGN